jgi:putative two-component system response regulator
MPAKPKILLIEGHIPTAMLLVASLSQAWCETEVATTGKRAQQLAQEFDFDLIALDPYLPDARGFETFLHLRQITALSATPIIFVARHCDDADWRRGLALGAADYIEKPFSGPSFLRRILSHIKHKSRPDLVAVEIP